MIQKYIEKVDAEIAALIEKESGTATTAGERDLHHLFENRKHVVKWDEDKKRQDHPATVLTRRTSVDGAYETSEHHARNELDAAETYLAMGLSDFAKDALRHAGYWIDAIAAQAEDGGDEAETARELVSRHGHLAKKAAAV